MPEYVNHVRLTLDGHEWPEGAEMHWMPSPVPEGAAPMDAEQLINYAVNEAAEVLDRAEAAFFALLDVLAPGEHTLTCTTDTADGLRIACFRLLTDGAERISCEESEALGFWVTIGSGFVAGSRGAVIVRSTSLDGEESARAWIVDPGCRWLLPCTADEVRNGYRHASAQGVPDPDPDPVYLTAESLPLGQSS